MDKIISFEQIQLFIKKVRAQKKGYVTNFYWDSNKHPYWLASGLLQYEESEECVLMFHDSGMFTNFYYIATNLDAVENMLNSIKLKNDLVVDVVCKGDGNEVVDTFKKMGFEFYRNLYRMSHIGQIVQHDWPRDSNVVKGNKDDAAKVLEILNRDFDPLCEQIPLLKELEDFAERGELSIIKDKNNICGFLIAEITGATWYLRYWYISPDYRNQGIGARLIKTSLIDGILTKRQIFWVLSDNENAIKRYEHYGFSKEIINDYVLIKRV